jgi:Pectate lyase superfamily protein
MTQAIWAVLRPPMLAAAAALLISCNSSERDDTTAVQMAVDRGGVVNFPSGTYLLSKTIVVRKSNTTIQGTGPRTVFIFNPSAIRTHCENDRAFTTPCDVSALPVRQISNQISVGDVTFKAVDDTSDLQPGDWLIVTERDAKVDDFVAVDWARVESTDGRTVTVRNPFRVAFSNSRAWVDGKAGLGFRRIPDVVEGTQLRDFAIRVPQGGVGSAAVGVSVFAALHTQIDNINVDDYGAQSLYSYLSKDLTITNSSGQGHSVLNEFAATVDLTLEHNVFGKSDGAALGLNLGTAFFSVTNNALPASRNIGLYLMLGVHDGIVSDNVIEHVASSSNSTGILAWGTQNVRITDNYLASGDGPESLGISVRDSQNLADVPIASTGNVFEPNRFGSGWNSIYDPDNAVQTSAPSP